MRELSSFNPDIPSTAEKPKSDVNMTKLINEVLQDEWGGATNFDRATAARSELFSRLRFPVSSSGKPLKKPE